MSQYEPPQHPQGEPQPGDQYAGQQYPNQQPQYGQPQYGQGQYGQQPQQPQYGQQQPQQPPYGGQQYGAQQQYPNQQFGQPGRPAPSGPAAPQPTPLVANEDYTAQFAPQEVAEGKTLSVIGYLGILFLLPMLMLPNNRFARFHANQSLVNVLAGIVLGIGGNIVGAILHQLNIPLLGGVIGWLCSLVPLVLLVLGMVNAGSGKAKTLPVIGKVQLLK